MGDELDSLADSSLGHVGHKRHVRLVHVCVIVRVGVQHAHPKWPRARKNHLEAKASRLSQICKKQSEEKEALSTELENTAACLKIFRCMHLVMNPNGPESTFACRLAVSGSCNPS